MFLGYVFLFSLYGLCIGYRNKYSEDSKSIALMYGAIGSTVQELSSIPNDNFLHTNEGFCHWDGTGPFCNGKCQYSIEEMRSKDGYLCELKIDGDLFGRTRMTNCPHNLNFGAECLTGNKCFCCNRDYFDIRWTGEWTSALTGKTMNCYYKATGRCGFLNCSNFSGPMSRFIVRLGGYQCTEVHLHGDIGLAEPGLIKFPFYGKFYKTS